MFEVVYHSLSAKIEDYVARREPHSRLPGIRELSREFNVNPKTMSKALWLLADRNLIEITPQGIFVSAPEFNYVQVFYTSFHRELQSDYWSLEVQKELSRVLALRHYSMVVGYLVKGQTVADFIAQHGVSPAMKNGVFFVGYLPDDEDIRVLRSYNLPLVILGDKTGNEPIASCGDAVHLEIITNLEHLIWHGHRKIAVILDFEELSDLRKIAGQVLLQHGLPVNNELFVHALPWEFNDGKAAVNKLIENGIEFSAILSFGDQVTLAVIKTCLEHRLRIPEDVAIAGNALPWVQQASPVLPTGFHSDMPELTRNMTEIMDIQKNGGAWDISRKIPPKFVVGHSCGCSPAATDSTGNNPESNRKILKNN